MAGTSVLKLKVDDKEYNSSLKQAQQGMQHLEQALKDAGKSFKQVDKSVVDYVRGIGQMEAQSKTARGRISEMSSAFIELSLRYKNMSDEVKSSNVGKALAESIQQLKNRTIEAKSELEDLNKELSNTKMPEVSSSGGGGFSDAMNGLTGKFLKANLYAMAAEKGAEALQSLGQHVIDVTKRSYELAAASEGIVLAFNRLNRPDLLDKLREATHGTVSDLELMKQAVKFDNFKLPLNDLATYLAFAQQKAKDTGESIDYLVNSIVTGLGRQSKQILDNLGISASELTKRMNEGKSMTEAVAEIIREEMDKTGGYVETASDRMARSTADVENAMLQLGTTMQDTFDGASIDEISNKLEMQLIAELNSTVETIGLVKEAFSGLGVEGNQVMDALINAVSQTYHNLSLLINPTMELLRLYNKFTGDEKVRIEGLHEGNEQITSPRSTTTTTTTPPKPPKPRGSGSSTVKTEEQENAEQIRKLANEFEKASETRRKAIQAEIKALQQRNAEIKYYQDIAMGKSVRPMEAKVDTSGLGQTNITTPTLASLQDQLNKPIDTSAIVSPLQALEDELRRIMELQAAAWSPEQFAAYQERIDEITGKIDEFKGIKQISKDWQAASSAIQAVGSAMSQIEDPSAKVMGTIAQAIATIALGYAQATTSAAKLGPWAWIAFAATGLATMISTISAIHSATGYAQGGIVDGRGGGFVGGTAYSGDNVGNVRLDSGELVLNKSQQSNLASALDGNPMNSLNLTAVVSGEQILLVANRTTRRQGKGELLTWR